MTQQLDILGDLKQFDASRDGLIRQVLIVSKRIATVANNRLSFHLQEMIRTVARLTTVRSLDAVDPVDWTADEWAAEMHIARSTAYKLLKMAQASGAIRGEFGHLVLDRDGLRRWIAGDEPSEVTKAVMKAAYSGSRPSHGRRSPSAARTEVSAARTEVSAARNHTTISYTRTAHGSGTGAQAVRRTDSSHNRPGPAPGPMPKPGSEAIHFRTTPTASGIAAGRDDGSIDSRMSDRPNPLQLDSRMSELPAEVAETPIIAEAAERLVDPLEPRSLLYGVWAKLEERHLRSPGLIVEWFRRQLSIPNPVLPANEAYLVLAIAAALHAVRMPSEQVAKSRVAVFVSIVSRGQWRKVLARVPSARESLDELLQRHGDALLSSEAGMPHLEPQEANH